MSSLLTTKDGWTPWMEDEVLSWLEFEARQKDASTSPWRPTPRDRMVQVLQHHAEESLLVVSDGWSLLNLCYNDKAKKNAPRIRRNSILVLPAESWRLFFITGKGDTAPSETVAAHVALRLESSFGFADICRRALVVNSMIGKPQDIHLSFKVKAALERVRDEGTEASPSEDQQQESSTIRRFADFPGGKLPLQSLLRQVLGEDGGEHKEDDAPSFLLEAPNNTEKTKTKENAKSTTDSTAEAVATSPLERNAKAPAPADNQHHQLLAALAHCREPYEKRRDLQHSIRRYESLLYKTTTGDASITTNPNQVSVDRCAQIYISYTDLLWKCKQNAEVINVYRTATSQPQTCKSGRLWFHFVRFCALEGYDEELSRIFAKIFANSSVSLVDKDHYGSLLWNEGLAFRQRQKGQSSTTMDELRCSFGRSPMDKAERQAEEMDENDCAPIVPIGDMLVDDSEDEEQSVDSSAESQQKKVDEAEPLTASQSSAETEAPAVVSKPAEFRRRDQRANEMLQSPGEEETHELAHNTESLQAVSLQRDECNDNVEKAELALVADSKRQRLDDCDDENPEWIAWYRSPVIFPYPDRATWPMRKRRRAKSKDENEWSADKFFTPFSSAPRMKKTRLPSPITQENHHKAPQINDKGKMAAVPESSSLPKKEMPIPSKRRSGEESSLTQGKKDPAKKGSQRKQKEVNEDKTGLKERNTVKNSKGGVSQPKRKKLVKTTNARENDSQLGDDDCDEEETDKAHLGHAVVSQLQPKNPGKMASTKTRLAPAPTAARVASFDDIRSFITARSSMSVKGRADRHPLQHTRQEIKQQPDKSMVDQSSRTDSREDACRTKHTTKRKRPRHHELTGIEYLFPNLPTTKEGKENDLPSDTTEHTSGSENEDQDFFVDDDCVNRDKLSDNRAIGRNLPKSSGRVASFDDERTLMTFTKPKQRRHPPYAYRHRRHRHGFLDMTDWFTKHL